MSKKHTIQECLAAIGVEPAEMKDAGPLEAQFNVIKKKYYRRILVCHPDKVGRHSCFNVHIPL